MRKLKFSNVLRAFLALIILVTIMNIPVTTRQGIDFCVRTTKIPLYIKVLEFMDRDYHYRALVKNIVKGCESEEEKLLAIFKWVCQNIRTNVPGDWPIVDDHVWSIIVRGYGVGEQPTDVFATLCVYASFDTRVKEFVYDSERKMLLSAVKLKGEWALLDLYYKIYFKTPSMRIATVKNLLSDPFLVKNQTASILHRGVKYSEYFKDLASVNFDELPRPRAYRHNLFKRIFYEIKRFF